MGFLLAWLIDEMMTLRCVKRSLTGMASATNVDGKINIFPMWQGFSPGLLAWKANILPTEPEPIA